jgi:hypothetical protein
MQPWSLPRLKISTSGNDRGRGHAIALTSQLSLGSVDY